MEYAGLEYLFLEPQNNKYENGKIYRLINSTTGESYIGSTTEKLSIRYSKHKYLYKKYVENNKKFKPGLYTTAVRLFNDGDSKIELVEEYACESRRELLERERYWIEWYKNYRGGVVNKSMPFSTRQDTNKRYYDSIKSTMREQVYCQHCDKSIKRYSLRNHKNSKKHIINMTRDNINEPDS